MGSLSRVARGNLNLHAGTQLSELSTVNLRSGVCPTHQSIPRGESHIHVLIQIGVETLGSQKHLVFPVDDLRPNSVNEAGPRPGVLLAKGRINLAADQVRALQVLLFNKTIKSSCNTLPSIRREYLDVQIHLGLALIAF